MFLCFFVVIIVYLPRVYDWYSKKMLEDLSKMTKEEFYSAVMSSTSDHIGAAINTSPYSLEEQLSIFENSRMDIDNQELLAKEIREITR